MNCGCKGVLGWRTGCKGCVCMDCGCKGVLGWRTGFTCKCVFGWAGMLGELLCAVFIVHIFLQFQYGELITTVTQLNNGTRGFEEMALLQEDHCVTSSTILFTCYLGPSSSYKPGMFTWLFRGPQM